MKSPLTKGAKAAGLGGCLGGSHAERHLLRSFGGIAVPWAMMKFDGRDALLRVRDSKPNTDVEHRVPTRSGLYDQPNFSQLPTLGRGEPMLATISFQIQLVKGSL